MKNILLIFLCCLAGKQVMAQDPQFSQFYAAPLYLAPSFAGTTDGSRFALNFRDQWPAIPKGFVTYAACFDHNIQSLSSGIGINFMRDQAGSGKMARTTAGIAYSYRIPVTEKIQVRPGISFYNTTQSIDFYNLTFGDQITLSGTASNSIEVPILNKTNNFDAGASLLTYSEAYWFGSSIDHLIHPNQTFFMGSESILPMKLTVFGGGKFKRSKSTKRLLHEESLSFAFMYKMQGKYDQFDLGGYWSRAPLITGIWYRGLPLFKGYSHGYANNDAIVILIGLKTKACTMGYSYDLTISRLAGNSGGSHELSLLFKINQAPRKRKASDVPCPQFTDYSF
ncbi:MAG: PorP/SprF family type IX secretion system membrane protein [Bacteroidota bacterium]